MKSFHRFTQIFLLFLIVPFFAFTAYLQPCARDGKNACECPIPSGASTTRGPTIAAGHDDATAGGKAKLVNFSTLPDVRDAGKESPSPSIYLPQVVHPSLEKAPSAFMKPIYSPVVLCTQQAPVAAGFNKAIPCRQTTDKCDRS